MSFRMRGQAYCAAQYAATWVLIVSMSSSAVVMGAPTRRETRRAKKNCCPQPATCSACNTCDACGQSDATSPAMAPNLSPTTAPTPAPAQPPPDPKPPSTENANSPTPAKPAPSSTAPPIPDSGQGSPASTPAPEPKAETPPATPTTENEASSETSFRDAAPVTVSDEAPPEPSTLSAPAIERPHPADVGKRYQEYLNRYFDRKHAEAAPKHVEEPALEQKPVATPPPDEAPTLTPSKPAKEYNDPFRPTSYRTSPERTWRDSSGASRMKARFLGVDDRGMAQMQREDGRLTRVPLANLSQEDLRFIELLAIRDSIAPTQAIASRPKGR